MAHFYNWDLIHNEEFSGEQRFDGVKHFRMVSMSLIVQQIIAIYFCSMQELPSGLEISLVHMQTVYKRPQTTTSVSLATCGRIVARR